MNTIENEPVVEQARDDNTSAVSEESTEISPTTSNETVEKELTADKKVDINYLDASLFKDIKEVSEEELIEPVESIEDKNYGKPIAQPALEAVVQKIMNLSEKYSKKKDEVLNKYKSQFGITSEKIGPADIRTAEQGQFLTLLINEIDSTL